MPEGHVIHRIARLHTHLLAGQRLKVTSPQGRFAADAKKVSGRTLAKIVPHGKHLFYHFDGGRIVHVHLGMHGLFRTLRVQPDGTFPPVRGQVRMRLEGDRRAVELTGPTACETLSEKETQAIHARLGPDLLDPTADAEVVWQRVHASRAPVGVLLMDQSVMSGIGNAYRAEILYRARLHPLVPGNALTRGQFDALWRDSVTLLEIGLKHKHILTVDREEIGKDFRHHGPDERFSVYRKTHCRRCGTKVKMLMMAGRECYYCPKEQPATGVAAKTPAAKKAVRPAKPRPKRGGPKAA